MTEDGEFEQTLGEYRTGVDFNPSGDERVNRIKTAVAALIDAMDGIETIGMQEIRAMETERLKALAKTYFEIGGMLAVKAATKPPRR